MSALEAVTMPLNGLSPLNHLQTQDQAHGEHNLPLSQSPPDSDSDGSDSVPQYTGVKSRDDPSRWVNKLKVVYYPPPDPAVERMEETLRQQRRDERPPPLSSRSHKNLTRLRSDSSSWRTSSGGSHAEQRISSSRTSLSPISQLEMSGDEPGEDGSLSVSRPSRLSDLLPTETQGVLLDESAEPLGGQKNPRTLKRKADWASPDPKRHRVCSEESSTVLPQSSHDEVNGHDRYKDQQKSSDPELASSSLTTEIGQRVRRAAKPTRRPPSKNATDIPTLNPQYPARVYHSEQENAQMLKVDALGTDSVRGLSEMASNSVVKARGGKVSESEKVLEAAPKQYLVDIVRSSHEKRSEAEEPRHKLSSNNSTPYSTSGSLENPMNAAAAPHLQTPSPKATKRNRKQRPTSPGIPALKISRVAKSSHQKKTTDVSRLKHPLWTRSKTNDYTKHVALDNKNKPIRVLSIMQEIKLIRREYKRNRGSLVSLSGLWEEEDDHRYGLGGADAEFPWL